MPRTKSSPDRVVTNGPNNTQYRRLLDLRVQLGEQVIDQLCHGRHDGAAALNDECCLLDEQLDRRARFRYDYAAVVLAAEEARFHQPDETLAGTDAVRPCRWCRRAINDLPADIALPHREAA